MPSGSRLKCCCGEALVPWTGGVIFRPRVRSAFGFNKADVVTMSCENLGLVADAIGWPQNAADYSALARWPVGVSAGHDVDWMDTQPCRPDVSRTEYLQWWLDGRPNVEEDVCGTGVLWPRYKASFGWSPVCWQQVGGNTVGVAEVLLYQSRAAVEYSPSYLIPINGTNPGSCELLQDPDPPRVQWTYDTHYYFDSDIVVLYPIGDPEPGYNALLYASPIWARMEILVPGTYSSGLDMQTNAPRAGTEVLLQWQQIAASMSGSAWWIGACGGGGGGTKSFKVSWSGGVSGGTYESVLTYDSGEEWKGSDLTCSAVVSGTMNCEIAFGEDEPICVWDQDPPHYWFPPFYQFMADGVRLKYFYTP